MDAPGGRATFGVAGIENGQGFDCPETKTDHLSHKRAINGSEGHRREGAEKRRRPSSPMKMLSEYLERAVELEKRVATEPNDVFRAEL
jgi:hypothetical protein